ncbi:MAG TPA: c-type cytochrome [Gemmatimonadaceae bacterium]|nr:c-type cytochrome [Gemmatimonadaceae bacterium]
MRSHISRAWIVAALALSRPGSAQIPSRFENLRVLPKDISRDSLLSVMLGFANGLGVQCGYCHSGGDPRTLVGVQFKADDKPAKVRARAMYTITSQVNALLRADTAGRQLEAAVTCLTCHRGLPDPRPLHEVLAATMARAGTDSGLAQYRDLRTQFLDRGHYDFGEGSLNMVAQVLAREGRRDDAIRALELNKEFHPDLPTLNFNLAELLLARGDSARALELFQLVLAKQPLNGRAKARVDALRAVLKPHQ